MGVAFARGSKHGFTIVTEVLATAASKMIATRSFHDDPLARWTNSASRETRRLCFTVSRRSMPHMANVAEAIVTAWTNAVKLD